MTVEVDSHADYAAVVALQHGGDPDGYLFLAALNDGGRIIGTIRTRLADPPDARVTVRAVAKAGWELIKAPWDDTAKVLIVAFGQPDIADPFLGLAQRTLKLSETPVVDVLLVYRDRCWSYLCLHPDHCLTGAGEPVDWTSDATIQAAIELTQPPPQPGGHDGQ